MLKLAGITAGYGGTTVLRSVDLVVPPHSVVALLGANGAGKTTLLRVASGLLPPSAGVMTLGGEDVTRRAPNELVARGICHVPEGRGIFPSLTVRENLVLQSAKGEEAASLDRAVKAFPRLGERMAQLAGTMSGGEQQMLALARTYVQHPTVVLLDEVSMGLAPKIVDEIFEFLALLRSSGASLLLVEQYVTRALDVADYVYMLNRGEVSFAGEPGELADEDVFASYVGG
ncbi:ABC transporter ATP-binding protein [Sporichthya sp.]|uniref:ABC transporter ATP-binding protein n=1 Tax=Sporichthya sp. TaxID=65475 RepID=UPI0018429619|nr:ABC transporter ATP-binding protein [Sporichthya sp.]MBA3741840.1 ABC transporter ATP-binding protein [Sporichthya sp.]